MDVLEHTIALKADRDDDDLPAWEWLRQLVKMLGEHGVSSEESTVENEIEQVLRVKKMPWRRCIDHELEIVDIQRILDNDVFSPRGAKPVKRVRANDNPISARDAVVGLPVEVYDRTWIAGLTRHQLESLNVSNEKFAWMTVAIVGQ